VRQAAKSDALIAIGPSCSAVAEALFQTLQHTVDDSSDIGIQMPVFTDSAMKAKLTRISQWAFRNSPNETDMYTVLWRWVHEHYPRLRTVFGGEERDFAHSHSTWRNIIAPHAAAAGMILLGQTSWSLTDRTFTSPVASMKAARADVIVISGHAATTCGVLRELVGQHVRPQLLVGLTSASTSETLQYCSGEAEGLLIPTSFAPQNAAARMAAKAVERAGGIADLHSMAGWEIMFTLSRLIQNNGIVGAHDTVAMDRRKLRDALANLTSMEGLLGPIGRSADREAQKPFVLVQARHGTWQVVYATWPSAAE
jgi:branched-chain amino acid transport system substrate-binding protein